MVDLGIQEIVSSNRQGGVAPREKLDLPEWMVDHSQRVGKLAVLLAKALGITDRQDLRAVELGGLLHDLGKAEVEQQVLDKPGKLTEKEWAIMKRHPEASLRLALDMKPNLPQLTREALIAHHENWDGSGYPRGLAGDEIPWAARLVAVADQWDSLINDRPYRKAFPQAEAMKILMNSRGNRLDPEMVEVFFEKVVGVELAN